MISKSIYGEEITLNGRINRIRYESEKSCIAELRTDENDVIGVLTNIFLREGQKVSVTGIIEDKGYGPQIKTDNIVLDFNDDEWFVKFMVESLRGVGYTSARKIYDCFHEKSFNIIRTEPERLKEAGIKSNTIRSIQQSLEEYSAESEDGTTYFDYVALQQLIGAAGTLNTVKKLFAAYGKNVFKVVKDNPYALIKDIPGFGFDKADRIACGTGIMPDSPFRIKAAINQVIYDSESTYGNCFCHRSYACKESAKLLSKRDIENMSSIPYIPGMQIYLESKKITTAEEGQAIISEYLESHKNIRKSKISMEKIPQLISQVLCKNRYLNLVDSNIDEMISKRDIVYEKDFDALYSASMQNAEQETAELIKNKLKTKPAKKISLDYVMNYVKEHTTGVFDEVQAAAVHMALNNSLSVITGGPGRGKSVSLRHILDIIGRDNVIMLAPTGKAVQRMKDANDCEAFTIHKLVYALDFAEKFPNIPQKIVDAYKKSTCIIADETSMIDIRLALALLKLTGPRKLILVGDFDQLPSVGPGLFFKHLIESGIVPTTKLIHVYRSTGLIAVNAKHINEKENPGELEQDESFVVYDNVDDDNIREKVMELYAKTLKTKNPKTGKKYQPKDIGVLVPMKKEGNASCNSLNETIRNKINPDKSAMKKSPKFRVHDRIMITRNNYKIPTMKDGEEVMGVFNGECGEITKIITVTTYKDNFKKRGAKATTELVYRIKLDDDRIFDIPEKDEFVQNLELAYAISIHKSQGSEYPVVITACTPGCQNLNKEMLYTAVTRAKQTVYLLGTDEKFKKAVQNVSNEKRYTLFKERLLGMI